MWLIETKIELEERVYVLGSEDVTRIPDGQGEAAWHDYAEEPVCEADEVR
jgi:hypothetical protein